MITTFLNIKNTNTCVFVKHHLENPQSNPNDKLSHVYTGILILKPDNELRIFIDGKEKKKTNFLSADDFEPALIPSKTIRNPDDRKPKN